MVKTASGRRSSFQHSSMFIRALAERYRRRFLRDDDDDTPCVIRTHLRVDAMVSADNAYEFSIKLALLHERDAIASWVADAAFANAPRVQIFLSDWAVDNYGEDWGGQIRPVGPDHLWFIFEYVGKNKKGLYRRGAGPRCTGDRWAFVNGYIFFVPPRSSWEMTVNDAFWCLLRAYLATYMNNGGRDAKH